MILDTNALSAFVDGDEALGARVSGELRDFEIVPVTEDTTIAYANIRAALKKAGRPIPANDAWIASLALQHRLRILSRHEHFDAVPGIRRESW